MLNFALQNVKAMYQVLLPLHSLFRWLLVAGVIFSMGRSVWALYAKTGYQPIDRILRSATSGISHVQLIIGLILYVKSPLVTYLRSNPQEALAYMDVAFFGIFHLASMVLAILLITIGAAKAKRAPSDREKYLQVLRWFGLAVLLILVAIPWPFSPYAARPYFRMF